MSDIRPMFNVDFPDPDIIRVKDTYYMLCTTMFYFPGCEILSSKDLVNWKHAAYVYNSLEGTDNQRLNDGNIYSAGMWAASLRWYNGTFYICFVANDTQKTYLFRSSDINGPWIKSEIEGFYHDNSLLFDDDGRVYIAYGNRYIYITELNDDLTGPKVGGLHRLVVSDRLNNALGYEGTHIYKINGYYYLFFIHSVEGRWFRTEACYRSESLEGDFTGREVFCDDNGYRNAGIAQGAIVDTAEGNYYAILFQDRGGSGRIPYLIPMRWEDGWPVIGEDGRISSDSLTIKLPEDSGLVGSDDFRRIYDEKSCYGFADKWQFNHEPDMMLIKRDISGGCYSVTTDRVCQTPVMAKNSLTQRMKEPECVATITVNAEKINIGDYAGLTALQYLYGFIGIRRDEDGYSIIYMEKPDKDGEDIIHHIARTDNAKVSFRITASFGPDEDVAEFAYDCGDGFSIIEYKRDMPFMLEFFTGYRYALTYFSTITSGGEAVFSEFIYD